MLRSKFRFDDPDQNGACLYLKCQHNGQLRHACFFWIGFRRRFGREILVLSKTAVYQGVNPIDEKNT